MNIPSSLSRPYDPWNFYFHLETRMPLWLIALTNIPWKQVQCVVKKRKFFFFNSTQVVWCNYFGPRVIIFQRVSCSLSGCPINSVKNGSSYNETVNQAQVQSLAILHIYAKHVYHIGYMSEKCACCVIHSYERHVHWDWRVFITIMEQHSFQTQLRKIDNWEPFVRTALLVKSC